MNITIIEDNRKTPARRDSNGSARRPVGREGAQGCALPVLNRGLERANRMFASGRRVPRLSMKLINISSLLMSTILAMSCFSVNPHEGLPESTSENSAISRRAAAEGMVLLENNGILPLKKGTRVALFGNGQINFVKGGTGSGWVNTAYTVNLLQGMLNKQNEGKIRLNDSLVNNYTAWIAAGNSGMIPINVDMRKIAAASDVAIVIISRVSGEGYDRSASRGDYYLSDAEIAMLDRVAAAFDQIIVVMNVGGIVDMTWVEKYPKIKAVLMSWLPGMEGGNAVADILCGDVNPSGKLTDTYARSYNDYPSASHFGNGSRVIYTEDIYVGYRYFETIDPEYKKVKYEFGYGKSYSNFEITDKKVTIENDEIVVTATVTNKGPYKGKEVLQVYYSAPQGKLNKPAKALAAFAKTPLLDINESVTMTMYYPVSDMASYDDTGKTGYKSAYVMELGQYNIYIGNSIKDADKGGIVYSYNLPETRNVLQLTEEMVPVYPFERLFNPITGETEHIGPSLDEYLKGLMVNIPAAGTASFSATAVSSMTNGVGFENIPGTDTQCIAHFNRNEEISYKLDVEKSGSYFIGFIYANGRPRLTNILDIFVNDTKQDVNVSMVQTGNGSANEWYNFTHGDMYPVRLTAGLCEIKLKSNGYSGNLKTIVIADNARAILNLPLEVPVIQDTGHSDLLPGTVPLATAVGGSIFSTVMGKMQLHDVYKDPPRMGEFLSMLTIDELCHLSFGHGSTIADGTGTIGSLHKYGIPPMNTADGPAGLRLAVGTTMMPMSTSQACTWNEALLEEIGTAIGIEAALHGVDVWLAPGMNIHRNPLCGRNFEYYSEDPLLTGKMAAAITRSVQSQGIGVTLKHYAANNQETGRNDVDTVISERALREIYLKGFEIAVKEGDPWCIMSSYNFINGIETSERYDLLTTVLRNEWGFNGLVMTDWGNNSSLFKEVKAGNDVKMPEGNPSSILNALQNNTLTRNELERNMGRVLNVIMRSRAFKNIIDNPHYYDPVIHIVKGEGVTRIKAAQFADSTGGPRPEATSDLDGGMNIGWMDAGGTLMYFINVEKGGHYDLEFRYAANSPNGAYRIFFDNNAVIDKVQFNNTHGWQNWRTSNKYRIALTAGEHIFTIDITGSGSNLNWMQFYAVDAN
jgi:beta-glucosidase-like glycosyl hydrolase